MRIQQQDMYSFVLRTDDFFMCLIVGSVDEVLVIRDEDVSPLPEINNCGENLIKEGK